MDRARRRIQSSATVVELFQGYVADLHASCSTPHPILLPILFPIPRIFAFKRDLFGFIGRYARCLTFASIADYNYTEIIDFSG